MGTGRGNNQERTLQTQANQAQAQIQPSLYQQYQQPKDLKLLQDLDSGQDVKDIEGLRWSYNLFQNAGKDPDVSGLGLLGNNALSGTNSKMLGVVSEQLKKRERQENEGLLYDSVQDAREGAMRRSQGFAEGDDSRNFGRANLANQRYTAYLNRPQQPSLLSSIIGGAAQVGAAWISRP